MQWEKNRPQFIRQSFILKGLVGLVGLLGLLIGLGYLTVDYLWFQEVGYLPVFWTVLKTQVPIAVLVTAINAIFLLGNLKLANRLQHPMDSATGHYSRKNPIAQTRRRSPPPAADKHQPFPTLSLRWLLPIVLGLSLLIGILCLHYGYLVWDVVQTAHHSGSLLPVPAKFRPGTLWQEALTLFSPQTPIGIPVLVGCSLLLILLALLVYPRSTVRAIALALSVSLGLIMASHWGNVLQFLFSRPFHRSDPLFSLDIGFYIFTLPILQLLETWLAGLIVFACAAVCLVYLLSGGSLSQGRFIGFSHCQQRHLLGLLGSLMLVGSFVFGLNRFELLYSRLGVVYGAGYTDIHVRLPVYTILSILAAAIALICFWSAVTLQRRSQPTIAVAGNHWLASGFKNSVMMPLILLAGYVTLAILGNYVLPDAVQRLSVQPNELAREKPYLTQNIAFTRQAFSLDQMEVEPFSPTSNLTYQDIQNNDLTIRNIRLWDTRPLLETNRQLQQIRTYYRFFDADIDRYTLFVEPDFTSAQSAPAQAKTEKQQVLIAARELDYTAIPQEAQTWVNQHLVYTHGYGFTLSPVNKVAEGGLPYYFVKNIGSDTTISSGGLTVSSASIRNSIPIGFPRIYFGELTNNYVMTNTRVRELDFPRGNENVYNTYDGTGGISIGAYWRRWLFSAYLKDWQMVFTRNFLPQTRLLFRRNINDRIRRIAPFLQYDRDPYLVVANADPNNPQNSAANPPNYLYWIIDAYTTSDLYPYSAPTPALSNTDNQRAWNYIRNSVKVVVDAYNGSMAFYVADPTDPMIQTWTAVFPNLFKPLSAMPLALKSHIRYPIDLFVIQTERLLAYHMTDPQVFYNREDLWQIPTETYGGEQKLVEPYYLITKLPTLQAGEEFIQLLPFTPNQRNNLIAWLAARSDGRNYGKSLLYVFPKERLIFGPAQVEARINQEPAISERISLWNRQGSRAQQGNLLIIPIEKSLLYVEPLYLEAEQNSLPTLARVIVAFENQIAMTETLERSLQSVFRPKPLEQPIIIRQPEP
jgi:uncharacterized membrane protein (UPF0182 family)